MDNVQQMVASVGKDYMGFLFFCLAGFLGMVVHWAKRWVRDETDTTLFRYLFKVQGKYTAISFLTYFAVIAGILALGTVDYNDAQSLAISFLAGYMIDSSINKDIPNE